MTNAVEYWIQIGEKQYNCDLDTLQLWIRQGRVTANHMVWSQEHDWASAGSLGELKDVFVQLSNSPANLRKKREVQERIARNTRAVRFILASVSISTLLVVASIVALNRDYPAGENFTILDVVDLPPFKHSTVVRLNESVSEKDLRDLSFYLGRGKSTRYERVFITYYLPDMPVGEGAWAAAAFEPDLEVKIYGLEPQEEAATFASANEATGDIIGIWRDLRPYCRRITISKAQDDDSYRWEQEFKDGSILEHLLKPIGVGKFTYEKDNQFGEFFIINSDGDLELHDNDGLISTAKRMR